MFEKFMVFGGVEEETRVQLHIGLMIQTNEFTYIPVKIFRTSSIFPREDSHCLLSIAIPFVFRPFPTQTLDFFSSIFVAESDADRKARRWMTI